MSTVLAPSLTGGGVAASGATGAIEGEDTILVIQHDSQVLRSLCSLLCAHGFRVCDTPTLQQARREIVAHAPATILLGLRVSASDGLDAVRRVRAWSAASSVIVLATGDRPRDKLDSLDAGADDYVTVPFATRDLLARIRAAIGRTRARRLARAAKPVLTLGPVRIDCARHEVRRDGVLVHLTPDQFRLLVVLSRGAGRVISHDQLTTEVWGPPPGAASHLLRIHMAALRRKLEVDPSRPRWILRDADGGYRVRTLSIGRR